jgi:type I restriction enzyme S subunit
MARSLAKDAIPTGWKYDLLDKFAIRCSGHTPSKSFPEYWDGGIKWISLADSFRLDQGYVYETDKEISEAGIANSSAELHPAETVVLSRDAGIGKSGVMAEPMAVSQHFIAWKCDNTEKLNSWFLYNWLQLNKAEFERQAVGSTIKTIGLPYFKKLRIAVPPYSEQKKIAQILSTWDKAITTTEQLLANSQQQKKALMQQLLTGNKRLLDTNGDRFSGEWKTYKFDNLFKERVESGRDDLPLLSITADDGVVYQEDTGRKNTSNEDKSRYRRICVNDIGYNTMRMWQGRSSLSDKEGIVSPAYTIVTPTGKVCPAYAAYLFKLPALIHVFYRHSQGLVSDTWNLKFNHFKKISWQLPSIDEQQKIAAVLSATDQEITTLQQKLDALKQEKKALMQQLLTGKRRVKVEGVDNA